MFFNGENTKCPIDSFVLVDCVPSVKGSSINDVTHLGGGGSAKRRR